MTLCYQDKVWGNVLWSRYIRQQLPRENKRTDFNVQRNKPVFYITVGVVLCDLGQLTGCLGKQTINRYFTILKLSNTFNARNLCWRWDNMKDVHRLEPVSSCYKSFCLLQGVGNWHKSMTLFLFVSWITLESSNVDAKFLDCNLIFY